MYNVMRKGLIQDMLVKGEILKDRYKIRDILGQGACGTVYIVNDSQIPNVEWAIKEIWEGDLAIYEKQEALERFEREAHILKNLNHPGLPKVVDFFSEAQGHYLVMEYIEGQNFQDFCKEREGPIKQNEILPWILKICDILEYLHGQSPPVIYRDLKPSNIIITAGGRVKLIDFGIARHFDPEKLRDTINLGTPGFCAPEQYGSCQSDRRTDIYSFGATLYFVLSGQDITKFNFKFPDLRTHNPGVSYTLNDIIMKCLNVDPAKRFQSIGEIKKELELLRSFTFQKAAPGKRVYVSPNIAAFENMILNPWLKRIPIGLMALFCFGCFFAVIPSTYIMGAFYIFISMLGSIVLGGFIFLFLGYQVLKDLIKSRTYMIIAAIIPAFALLYILFMMLILARTYIR